VADSALSLSLHVVLTAVGAPRRTASPAGHSAKGQRGTELGVEHIVSTPSVASTTHLQVDMLDLCVQQGQLQAEQSSRPFAHRPAPVPVHTLPLSLSLVD
jgi:hypothetical protein